ncbi:MAG: HAD domain-containing protein [Rhodoferax sp.]
MLRASLEDVYRRQPKAWLAIDDDASDWPMHCRDRLVQTHEHEGISTPAVLAELKLKLREMCK